MSQRTDRVDELLRQEIGAIIARDVADPRIGFATITDVETTPDLRHAKVWVSVIGAAGRAGRHGGRPAPGDAVRAPRARRAAADQADPGAPRPARRLGRAGHARPAAPRASSRRATTPDGDAPVGESLPTPVPRLPHERRPGRGAAVRRRAVRSRGPDRGAAGHGRNARPKDRSRGDGRAVAVSVDLQAFLAAVPDVVVERLRGARRVLAVSHENPDADALGAALAIVRLVEARGGRGRSPSARTRSRRCTPSCPASSASGPTRTRTRRTTCWSSATAASSSRSARSASVTRSCSTACRASSIDHHASQRRGRRRRLDRARRGRHVRDGDPPGGPPRRPARRPDDGALAASLMAGIVMDTATFAHPNATPRTLAVSRRAGGRRGAALRHLATPLPHQAGRPAPRCSAGSSHRLESADDGRIVWSTRDRRGPRRDRAPTAPTRRASSTCCRRRRPPRSPSCSRRPGRRRRGSASGRSPAASMRPSSPAVRWRRARSGGGRDRRGAAGRGPAAGARRGDAPRRRGPALTMARASARPRAGRHPRRRQAGRPDLARRRRPGPPAGGDEAGRPRRDARPVRLRRAADLPGSRHPGRRVPPRRPQGLPGDGLLRRPRRRPTTSRASSRRAEGPAPTRDAVEAAAGGFTGDDLAAPAGLQRDQGRRPARVRDGSSRRDGRPRRPRR